MNAIRFFWFAFGFCCAGLVIVWIALPLLPTAPFLLLAAFAFARSSPRLNRWLLDHRRFGPMIGNWRQHGAISRGAKILAVCAMVATLGLTWLGGFGATILLLQTLVLSCVAAFILSRPEGPARS